MNEAVALPDTTVELPPPGAQLAAAREASGLSVTDVARQLKLSPWQVEALEAGNHGRLPGAVFERGFIRNYARLVKLDAAHLLAVSDRAILPATLGGSQVTPSADIPFPTGREFKWHKYAIAAIVVMVPVVIFEFYLDDAPAPTVIAGRVALPKPETGPANPLEQAPGAPPVAPLPDAVAAAPAAEQAARGTAAPDAPLAIHARRAGNEQLVRFRFAQASWVEIRDRDGRRIFSQFNPAGTEQVVVGLPPLSLVVGNAKGVDLSYNEKPVDLGPHTKVDVARLTLD